MVRLSGTGTFQVFVSTASIGLVRVVASFGSEATAGYTVAIRIVLFAILPAWGMSNAAAAARARYRVPAAGRVPTRRCGR